MKIREFFHSLARRSGNLWGPLDEKEVKKERVEYFTGIVQVLDLKCECKH